jgi:hypothetical protein
MRIFKYIYLLITIILIAIFANLYVTRMNGSKSLGNKEFFYYGLFIVFMILVNIRTFYNYFKNR